MRPSRIIDLYLPRPRRTLHRRACRSTRVWLEVVSAPALVGVVRQDGAVAVGHGSLDEIVMGEFSVLGPIDPQILGLPAASIVRARDSKPVADVSDLTLVLADVGEKAVAQETRRS